MDIIKLNGVDKKLYELVAPLVMNPAIIRQNNNYPFKTSRNHIWYLAIEPEDKLVRGFMPVKASETGGLIDNYYISGDEVQTISELLERITKDFDGESTLSALVHKRHIQAFAEYHFQTTKEWTKYNKMQYDKTDMK